MLAAFTKAVVEIVGICVGFEVLTAVVMNKHNKTLLTHSQLNLMCIYCTRTLTTCFGFNEPSSGEFHIQYTKLQAKCYKFYKSLKLVLKHKIYKINSIETKNIGIARINTQF
jgi:hypothetical protein